MVLFMSISVAQNLKSPSEFLGYELGTQFSYHHEMVSYFNYVATALPNQVQLKTYGKTNERRPLLLATISSAANMNNITKIQSQHLKSTEGESVSDKAIVWLSYNVHGNESVSMEASMQTLYELLTSKSAYLENTVVLMDPCINPDGRDRYANWYNQNKNTPHTIDPNSKEHHEGWLSGRSNHYMFDLNRDWAWLTQVESQQRLKVYNTWLPHVHVDFHEQGVDNPYYFAPAAEPYHEVITNFQRDFQVKIGKNHAKYFDENGWFYFTKEVFDLLYPSYGDTYPTYNGAIGMTYEQGGSGRAGLGITTSIGDTLTLKDRIAHHHTTGISTVEVASKNAKQLNEEFSKFYKNKSFNYKSYVLQGDQDKLNALTNLLDKHEITYKSLATETVKGYDYNTGKTGSLKKSGANLVVHTSQKKGTLVKVLFEPKAKLSDSVTYDITAWSLPYAYGLDAIASENQVATIPYLNPTKPSNTVSPTTYGYVTDWNSMEDARFLAALLKQDIRVRFSTEDFTISGKQFKRGSLIITASDNKNNSNFVTTLNDEAKAHEKELTVTNTGFVASGKDFGSSAVKMIQDKKIAVLTGNPTSTLQFGEIWHFFEQQLAYPVTVIDSDYFKRADISNYDVLILPDGYYGGFFNESALTDLKVWVRNGGKLIAMGNAIDGITSENGFSDVTKKETAKNINNTPIAYAAEEREYIKNVITGAIFKTKVDTTHPLAYGYTDTYYSLKLGSDAYNYLKSGTVVRLEENTPVSGFAGSNAQKQIENTLIFGASNYGRGQVIYMVDNPLFRGFWENGKLFFANALFMVH